MMKPTKAEAASFCKVFIAPSIIVVVFIGLFIAFKCFKVHQKPGKKPATLMKVQKKQEVLFGQPIPYLEETYDAEWLEYGSDKFNLSMFLRYDPNTFRHRLHLLDEIFGEVFGQLVGNRFRAYYLRVTVGNNCRITEQFGAFHHLQVVVMLADLNLTKVFKDGWIQVELSNILY